MPLHMSKVFCSNKYLAFLRDHGQGDGDARKPLNVTVPARDFVKLRLSPVNDVHS
jgi:hypothetical protein